MNVYIYICIYKIMWKSYCTYVHVPAHIACSRPLHVVGTKVRCLCLWRLELIALYEPDFVQSVWLAARLPGLWSLNNVHCEPLGITIGLVTDGLWLMRAADAGGVPTRIGAYVQSFCSSLVLLPSRLNSLDALLIGVHCNKRYINV